MNEVNQLILDCLARVLRINQTTDADIDFWVCGNVNGIMCQGFKNGYANMVAEFGEHPRTDFTPLKDNDKWDGEMYTNHDDAEQKLRNLLASLDELEKELIQSA